MYIYKERPKGKEQRKNDQYEQKQDKERRMKLYKEK